MIHDPDLLDRLSVLPTERFEGPVYRATGLSTDPTAPSISGGRWAPPPDADAGIFALYTSLERDGALAELCSFLADQTPVPGPRPIKVTRLELSTARTVRFSSADLTVFGIDLSQYGTRDYARTQMIGAALAFLEYDGLIAPSPRWPCNNLVIFTNNHSLTEQLTPVSEEQLEWRPWAVAHGLIPTGPRERAR